MLPVNPDINRGSKNYEFHRGNEEKTKDLINKCMTDFILINSLGSIKCQTHVCD